MADIPDVLGSAFVELRVLGGKLASDISDELKKAKPAAEKAGDDVAQSFGGSAKKTLGSAATGIAAAGVAAFAAIGAASVTMAAKFQEGLTTLETGAGESAKNLKMVGDGIKSIAVDTGTSTDQLIKGMYMVESAGFHGADGLKVLQAAAEGAKVGNADLGTVANATTTILTDYGLHAYTATAATSGLVATTAAGKVHMDDLATSLARVAPTAAALHVTYRELGGAMATMTGQGTSAKLAAMDLNAAMLALVKPSAGAAKEMAAVGISSKEVADTLTHKGLVAALEMVSTAALKAGPEGSAAYVAAMSTMMGGTRGLQVALETTGSHMKTLVANTQSIGEAMGSGSKDVKGWEAVQKDFNFQLSKFKEVAEVAGITIGQKLLPPVTKVLEFLDRSHILVPAVITVLGLMALAMVAVAANFVVATIAAMSFWTAVSLGLIPVIVALVAGIVLLVTHWRSVWAEIKSITESVWKFLLGLFKDATQIFNTITEPFKRAFDAVWKYLRDVFGDVSRVVSMIVHPFVVAFDTVKAFIVGAFNSIKSAITGGFDAWWKTHGDEIKEVWHAVWDGITLIFRGAWGIFMGVFHTATSQVASGWNTAWSVVVMIFRVVWDVILAVYRPAVAVLSAVFHTAMAAIQAAARVGWAVVTTVFHVAMAVITTVFKIGWDVLTAVVKVFWAFITAVIKTAWDIIVGIFSIALDLITGHWGRAWTDLKNVAIQIWNNIKGFFTTTWNAIKALALQIFNALKDGLKAIFNALWNFIWTDFGAKIANFFTNTLPGWITPVVDFVYAHFYVGLVKIFHDLYNWIWTDFGAKIYNFFVNTLPSWFTTAVGAIKTAWHAVQNAVLIPVNWVIQYVIDDGLIKAFDWISSKVGGPTIQPFPLLHAAKGARIPGYGGGDVHPALLEGGETVVSKEHSKILGPAFAAIGVPGYAAGGVIPGGAAASGKAGVAPVVSTGGGGGGLLGTIWHAVGDAASIVAALATGNTTALMNTLKKAVGTSVGGAVGDLAKLLTAIPKTLIKDAVTFLAGKAQAQAAASGGGGQGDTGSRSGDAAKAQAYARSQLARFGWGPDQMTPLIELWNQESGWSSYAVNRSSGAAGIAQSLGHGPVTLGDYVGQINWGLNYIKDRYGSPAGAWAHEVSNNWYGLGGVINEPVRGVGLRSGQSYMFGERGPETVIPGAHGNSGGVTLAHVCARLDKLASLLQTAPAATGAHVGQAISGAVRTGAARGAYGTR